MSVYSMTGYGSATQSADGSLQDGDGSTPAASSSASPATAAITVDVRSVNGRFLDVSIKAPDELRALEGTLRDLVATRVKRGKIELRVNLARESDTTWPNPTPEQLMQLGRIEATIRGFLDKAAPLSVHEAMQWCRQSPPSARGDDAVLPAAARALDAMVAAREREGARLAQALKANTAKLRELGRRAQPLIGSVIERQQQRFLERWREALAQVGAPSGTGEVAPEAAQERALSEAASYALRIDVAEELTRLQAHLDELDALLARGGELGKRLDFLVQEMHREANTLGSKSQALELTTISMDMKVAIEQMREQVQNIE